VGTGEEILKGREVLGWRFGLERMRRLCSLLGMPQNRFASIHVVGTNGKTSVARMTAALLEAQGVSAGAYVSPHILSWRERILIRGEPISERAFDAALERAEQSARVADRAAGEEGPVTQFELLTAAAFLAFADARVGYAVIEAGLGGRLDATNVIPSKLTVLTSVGLDHTEYLGETLEEIAAEKLAVLRDHTTLIRGEVPAEVVPVIEREVKERHAKQLRPPTYIGGGGPPGDTYWPSIRGYQQANLALAWAAAQEALGRSEPPDVEAAVRALTGVRIPGRAELIPGDPPVIFDAAHNADGARALFEVLPELTEGREIVCCLAVLEEKDAAGIVGALAPAISQFVCTEVPPEAIEGSGRPSGRSHPGSELASLCREAGVEAEAVADPVDAWRHARQLARKRDWIALAAGSHYLLSSIWTERHAASS
jgi:dihydrofolate synthase/folylpolyglutamate synthase